MNKDAADSLMNIFGFKRVDSKFEIGDYIYIDHAYRKIIEITASDHEYLYRVNPYPGRLIREGEIDD
jgi:hypothetical protein